MEIFIIEGGGVPQKKKKEKYLFKTYQFLLQKTILHTNNGWENVNNPSKHIYFILWILSPNKVQPLEKECNSAMSIDVFWEKSNRTYHETKVIECFRDFENIPLCLEMYDMLVRYNFYHCILAFPDILSSKDLKVWRLSLFQYMHLFPCMYINHPIPINENCMILFPNHILGVAEDMILYWWSSI